MPDLRARKTGMMTLDEYNEKAENFFSHDVEKGRQIAKELGTDFIAVNSNINSLYQGVFLELHGYSNSSAVLAVQKLFSHYYYSSAGEPEKARWGVEEDASDNVQFFSTESLQFYLARENVTRIEKYSIYRSMRQEEKDCMSAAMRQRTVVNVGNVSGRCLFWN